MTAALLFSTGGAAIKACSFSAPAVAGLRSLLAAITLAVLTPALRGPLCARSAAVAAVYAALMLSFVVANKMTTAANTIFLQSTAPLFILLLSPLLLREHATRRDLVLMIVLAGGLSLFFVGSDVPLATAPDPTRGDLVATVSGLLWALTLMGLRWLGADGDGEAAATALVLGNVLCFVACLPWIVAVDPSPSLDWLIVVYLGVFQVGLSYAFLRKGIGRVSALEASLLLLLEPVLNPVWAWLVHGEVPGAWAIVGGVVILTATTTNTLSSDLVRARRIGR